MTLILIMEIIKIITLILSAQWGKDMVLSAGRFANLSVKFDMFICEGPCEKVLWYKQEDYISLVWTQTLSKYMSSKLSLVW
ncbi:hypothetical protein ACJX0J_019299, partial [Zea mays]